MTFTATDITYSTTYKVFGTHGAVFNGTSSFITTPDNAGFNLAGGVGCIDARIYVTSLAANNPIYYQQTTAVDDSFHFYVDTTGALQLVIKTTADGDVVTCSTPAGSIAVDTWYHVALTESGSNYYIFVNGALYGQTTDADRAADYTGLPTIGSDGVAFFTGYMDEFRFSKGSARWTSNFTVSLTAYGTSTSECHL
jgi:hypothetical protein